MDISPQTKVCSKCHQEKPITEFSRSGLWGNRKAACKVCTAEYGRAYKANKASRNPHNK